jgi:hypothetical protein
MGCGIVKAAFIDSEDDHSADWSIGTYMTRSRSCDVSDQGLVILLDPSLPPLTDRNHIQLYELLNEPVAQTLLGTHAKSIDKLPLLMCWVEIEEFNHENVASLQLIQAVDIYETFIKLGSEYCLALPASEVSRYDTLLSAHTIGELNISKSFFAEVICPFYRYMYVGNRLMFIY